jgi:hypothetical protein
VLHRVHASALPVSKRRAVQVVVFDSMHHRRLSSRREQARSGVEMVKSKELKHIVGRIKVGRGWSARRHLQQLPMCLQSHPPNPPIPHALVAPLAPLRDFPAFLPRYHIPPHPSSAMFAHRTVLAVVFDSIRCPPERCRRELAGSDFRAARSSDRRSQGKNAGVELSRLIAQSG